MDLRKACFYFVLVGAGFFRHEVKLHESDFICYEVVLDQVLEPGDMVTFNKQKLHVFEVHTEMTRGILMADPDTKFLLTPMGQKIMFEKDKITIVGAENGASITLTNAGSIILNSVDKITLQTGKRIEMTGESIMMIGDQIEMSTKGDKGGIKIDQGQVVISGVEVLME